MRRLRFQVLTFTLIRVVLNTMYRMVYPFLPVFSLGLGVDLRSMSAALTVRAIAGALGPFLASISDVRGRRTGMLLGMGIFSLGTSVVVLWPSYPTFAAALILTVVGKSVFDPTMHAYLGDRVPYRRRGLAVGLVEFGWSFSFIVGVPLAGFLISRQGWMAPFPLLTLLGLISLGLVYIMIPNDPTLVVGPANRWGNFLAVFQNQPALSGLAVGLLACAANEMVNLVFGVWIGDNFGVQLATLGAASMVIGLAELGGESLVTSLTDRLGKPRSIAIGLLTNSLAALALPVVGRTLPGAYLGLFLFYLSFEFALVSIIPLMTEIMPANRATLVAANAAGLSLGRALGAVLTPLVFPLGIFTSVTVTVLLNLMGLLALRSARLEVEASSLL